MKAFIDTDGTNLFPYIVTPLALGIGALIYMGYTVHRINKGD